MITTEQAMQLRMLISTFATAQEEASWAGAQPPAEARELRRDLRDADLALNQFINSITAGPAPAQTPSLIDLALKVKETQL